MTLTDGQVWWVVIATTTALLLVGFSLLTIVILSQRRSLAAQRERRQQIELRERKYRELFDTVPDIVFVHGMDGIVLQVNPAFRSILGFEESEFIGKPLSSLLSPIYKSRIERYLKNIRSVGEAYGMVRIADKFGGKHVFEYRNALLTSEGPSGAIRGIARDITISKEVQRTVRESETRYRKLVERSPLPMLITIDEKIVFANAAAIVLFKCKDPSALLNRSLSEFIIEGKERIFLLQDDMARMHDGSVHSAEVTLRMLNDDNIEAEIVSLSVTFEGRNAVHSVIHDITQIKRYQETLRKIPKRILEAQEQERKEVTRDLHDAVIQLLYSIQLRLQTIEKVDGGSSASSRSGQIAVDLNDAIDEVRRIIHKMRPKGLDDLGLVPALRDFCQSYSKRTGISVTLDFSEIPTASSSAEDNLFRIVQEAFNNIEKHSKATGIEFALGVEGAIIVARIRDNGRGFDPLHSSKNGAYSGLGMNTMKERALALGGDIIVETAPGEGTTIFARIPISMNGLKTQ